MFAQLDNPMLTAAHSALLRKFTDLAFDESAAARCRESERKKMKGTTAYEGLSNGRE
jgi:hypothetical protein